MSNNPAPAPSGDSPLDLPAKPGAARFETECCDDVQISKACYLNGSNATASETHKQSEELAYIAFKPAIPAHSTDPFRRLPLEILLNIVGNLPIQDYDLLQIMRVSKTWHMALTRGLERQWEKKCRTIDAERLNGGCPTWYHTWVNLMHDRCFRCTQSTILKSYPLGSLWLRDGPAWAKLCHSCVYGSYIDGLCFERSSPLMADASFPNSPPQLVMNEVPSFPVSFPGSRIKVAYWKPTEWRKAEEMRVEKERRYRQLLASLVGIQDRVRCIVTSPGSDLRCSALFNTLLWQSTHYQTSISPETGAKIIKLCDSLKELLPKIRHLHALDPRRWSDALPRSCLGAMPLGKAQRRLGIDTVHLTWLDLIHLGKVTQEAFLDEYCNPSFYTKS